jgi:hypothetical protein
VSRITLWIVIVVNGFLALVTLAALIGIWFGGTSAVRTYSVHAGLHDVPSRHLPAPRGERLAGRHEYFLYIMCGTERLSNAALAVPAMVLLHPKEVPL